MIVIPGGAIDLDGTGADNYVATFTGPTTIGGEANLTFDGSTLTVNGAAVFNESSADVDFRIESNGNANMFVVDAGDDAIGIGTASTTTGIALRIDGRMFLDDTASNVFVMNSGGSDYGFIMQHSSDKWSLGHGTSITSLGTPVLLWTDGGDVGIGETSPDTVLHLKDSAPDITLEDSDGGDVYKVGNNGGNYRIRNVTDSRTDLNIEGGGHVGIGTASASSYHNFADDFVVYSTGETGITIATNDTSSGRGALYFNDTAHGTNNPQGYITYTHSNDYMYFGTNSNGSSSFYLDDSQNVFFAKDITIGSGTANDRKIVFDGNEHDFYVGLDDSTNYLTIGEGSTVGTNPYIRLVPSQDFAYGMIIGGTTVSSGASDFGGGVAFMPHITTHADDDDAAALVIMGGQLAGTSLVMGGHLDGSDGRGGTAATLWLSEPGITTNGNTLNNAATLYIQNAPTEATNDYALWVDDGVSRFDGQVHVDSGYLQASVANSGAANKIHLNNTSTTAASDATVEIYVNGQNDADPTIVWATTHSTNVYWSAGIDQSNSKSFAISNSYDIGGTDALRIHSSNQETTLTLALGSVFDYVCESCGRHEAERFECCGKVEWHDDVLALREMSLNRKGIEHMAKLGVMDISTNNDGSEWLGLNMQKSTQYTWSAMYQLYERINVMEKELQELRS